MGRVTAMNVCSLGACLELLGFWGLNGYDVLSELDINIIRGSCTWRPRRHSHSPRRAACYLMLMWALFGESHNRMPCIHATHCWHPLMTRRLWQPDACRQGGCIGTIEGEHDSHPMPCTTIHSATVTTASPKQQSLHPKLMIVPTE